MVCLPTWSLYNRCIVGTDGDDDDADDADDDDDDGEDCSNMNADRKVQKVHAGMVGAIDDYVRKYNSPLPPKKVPRMLFRTL